MAPTVVEKISLPKAFVYEGEAFVITDIEILNDIPALRLTVTDAWGAYQCQVMIDTAFLNGKDSYLDKHSPFEHQLLHAARRIVVERKANNGS
jgi:hypothetical protein